VRVIVNACVCMRESLYVIVCVCGVSPCMCLHVLAYACVCLCVLAYVRMYVCVCA